MKTIELHLNERTLELARQVATSRRCTLEELIEEISSQLAILGQQAILFGECLHMSPG
jgi:hypothetical protein